MFSPYVSQVIRLYTGTNHVEMEFTVGPILTKYDLLLKTSYSGTSLIPTSIIQAPPLSGQPKLVMWIVVY